MDCWLLAPEYVNPRDPLQLLVLRSPDALDLPEAGLRHLVILTCDLFTLGWLLPHLLPLFSCACSHLIHHHPPFSSFLSFHWSQQVLHNPRMFLLEARNMSCAPQ